MAGALRHTNIMAKKLIGIKELFSQSIETLYADGRRHVRKIYQVHSFLQNSSRKSFVSSNCFSVRQYSKKSSWVDNDKDELSRKQEKSKKNNTMQILYYYAIEKLNMFKIMLKLPSFFKCLIEKIRMKWESRSKENNLSNIEKHSLKYYDNSVKDENILCNRVFPVVPKPTLGPSQRYYNRKPTDKKTCSKTNNIKLVKFKKEEIKKKSYCKMCTNELIIDHIQNYVSDCSAVLGSLFDPPEDSRKKNHKKLEQENKIESDENLTPVQKQQKPKSCNALITNEEYVKKREIGLVMPERYFCGAGEIERKVIAARNKKMKPNKKPTIEI